MSAKTSLMKTEIINRLEILGKNSRKRVLRDKGRFSDPIQAESI